MLLSVDKAKKQCLKWTQYSIWEKKKVGKIGHILSKRPKIHEKINMLDKALQKFSCSYKDLH